jgi:predicted transcriptional regulator
MRSLTITLEGVPDELHAMTATPEGMARARAAVLDAFGLDEEEDEYQLAAEDLASLKRGIADADAGRTLSIEESEAAGRAELIARFAARKEKEVLP